jgi:hypothetical protein
MATASKVVTRVLEYILVQASEQPVQAADLNAGIDALNDMMTEWNASGIALGYTVVDDAGDVLTVSDSALGAIKYNLAMRLAPEFDAIPSQFLASAADNSFTNLLNSTIAVEPSSFPSTLPIGSGNECINYQRFYPESDGELLNED